MWISRTNPYFNFYLFLIITKWQIKNTNGIDLRLRVIYKYGFRLGYMYWSWWLQGLHDDIYETDQNVFLDSPVVSTGGVKRLQNTFNWKKKIVFYFSKGPMAALAFQTRMSWPKLTKRFHEAWRIHVIRGLCCLYIICFTCLCF